MGKVKFLFPNDEGIDLHDTPDRALLDKPDRHFSNGCIRLENAAKLGQWLMHRSIATKSKAPEQAVDRKSVVSGTSVSVRVDLGGRRIIKKKTRKKTKYKHNQSKPTKDKKKRRSPTQKIQ